MPFTFSSRCEDLYKVYPPANAIQQEALFDTHRELADSIDAQSAKTFNGFCNFMMRHWFSRIVDGKLTWSYSKHGGYLSYEQESERWRKKFEALFRMQTGHGNEALRKQYPSLDTHASENELVSRSIHVYCNLVLRDREMTLNDAIGVRDAIMQAQLHEDRVAPGNNPDILLHMTLGGRVGFHAVGIHLRPDSPTTTTEEIGASEWEVANRMDGDTIHFFDPNVGEFFVHKDQFPKFFLTLFNTVYKTPFTGRWFDSVTIKRHPIFWKQAGFEDIDRRAHEAMEQRMQAYSVRTTVDGFDEIEDIEDGVGYAAAAGSTPRGGQVDGFDLVDDFSGDAAIVGTPTSIGSDGPACYNFAQFNNRFPAVR